MPAPHSGAPLQPSREDRLAELIATYLEAVDAGRKPDVEELLRRDPELAPDFHAFLEGQGEMASLARALPRSAPEGRPGEVIGDYEILSEIARGGMGVVYRARQRSLKRAVALKMILAGRLATEEEVRRFRHEAESAARLDHPHIVPIYEVGEAQGRHYFSMKLVDGGSLAESRRRFEGDPRAVAGLIETVARAVQFAHDRGVLHRDLKPANILLDADGRPLITDFGLAKTLDPGSAMGLTHTGAIVGTLAYMAPEQAAPGKAPLTSAVDVYSLGAVLYDLLANRPPHSGNSPVETLRQVVEEDPQPARAVNPKVPRDLETIAMKCLEKDPANRYSTAAALADDLGRFLKHEPILARPPGAVRRVLKALRRHRLATAVLLAAAAGVAILAIIGWQQSEAVYRRGLLTVGDAIHAGDAGAARKTLSFLEEAYGARPAVARLASEVAELDRQGMIASSRKLREEGEAQVAEFHRLGAELASVERERSAAEGRHATWEPPWQRKDEFAAWYRLQRSREALETCYNQAIGCLSRAAEAAPPGSEEVRRALRVREDLDLHQYREALAKGGVSFGPAFFKSLIESMNLGTYARELTGDGRVSLITEPPGAEVYCFRFENHEERLLPIPFDPVRGFPDPARGLVGAPFLQVERIWDGSLSPLVAGDRLLSVNGRAVRLMGELADALSEVGIDQTIDLEALRAGSKVALGWIPFPNRKYPTTEGSRLRPGTVISAREQFGFTLSGYPLDLVPACRVGVTGEGSPLAVALPRGSYLLVLRKDGFAETRFPVAMPRRRDQETIRLMKANEVPPGFVYVPAGEFPCGGDRDAFQSLEPAEPLVDGFFIGRREVTVGEYLEFVNDPEVRTTINEDGKARPVSEDARSELRSDGLVQLIPWGEKDRKQASWARNREDRTWSAPWNKDYPILDVSHLAAAEYAGWRTRKSPRGWRYRLPTDLEWEKAARGMDRRVFVWGNYLVWCYSWSHPGNHRPNKTPAIVESTPADESVFGARDMAGSVNEHTSSRPVKEQRNTSRRGGSWYTFDGFCFRIATRNSILPENSSWDTGFRLAAELPAR